MDVGARLVRALSLGTVVLTAALVSACTTTIAGAPAANPSFRAPSSSVPPPASPTSTTVPAPPPTVPGWQVVVADKDGVAYDVPPDWKVQTPDDVRGFDGQQGSPEVTMNYVATDKDGFCADDPSGSRAETGVTSTSTVDPGQAASTTAQNWANDAFDNATTTAGAPQPITVGGDSGMMVRDTLVVHSSDSCTPPAAEIDVVALPLAQAANGCGLFILFADQGTPDSAPAAEFPQIINSLRSD
ncbi:MAG TPA: hypothetical protein VHZ97_14960 [Pseudonocardiaceae bacterium]|nr:hypothetical protein [Pseudonocardiaceae bacterium]